MCHASILSLVLLCALASISFVYADGSFTVSGEFCPKMCSCDLVDGLKRADCSNEKLINTYTDVPYGVEILDLSINMISSIEDDNFKLYINVVKLFLSENSIQTISLDAFSNLRRLTTLDLSHNRLEHLDELLFERNTQLVDLNLSNNNFMMLPEKPFLRSATIAFLHLSECRIPHIFDKMFINLPNLESLDLRQNIMKSLSTTPFAHLRRLNTIDLNGNMWDCNAKPVRKTIRWMKERIAMVHIDACFLTKIVNKFERMQEDPSLSNGRNERHDIAIEEVWNTGTQRPVVKKGQEWWPAFMNRTCSYSDRPNDPSMESCNQFVECQQKYGELYNAYVQLLERKDTKHSSYYRTGVLLGGILVGFLFGSFITYTVHWAVRKCRERSAQKMPNRSPDQKRLQRELRREFRDRNRFEHTRLNESPVLPRTDRTPGRGRRATSYQDEIYQNHEHTRQFLVNLFSKRQPRYVRSNSQLANITNRHIPPTQIRDTGEDLRLAPRAVSLQDGQGWEQQNTENFERDRMLLDGHAGVIRHSVEQQPTWMSIRPTSPTSGTLPRNTRRQDVPSESPPPPYVECTELQIEPKQSTVNMY
uniref:Uncharacterized protein n=1 Tax=Anopheles atroparvus TaxID=41427 RepID=A0A182JFG8_ANOAO